MCIRGVILLNYSITTVNSCYNEVGYNEITAYYEIDIFPRALNEYPDITKEFTGPKHFVITRVHCRLLCLFEKRAYFVTLSQSIIVH